jgi:hypothetical protein
MTITDVNGKMLLMRKNTSLPGNNFEKLDVSKFVSGMYFITIIEQSGKKRTVKMIKQ